MLASGLMAVRPVGDDYAVLRSRLRDVLDSGVGAADPRLGAADIELVALSSRGAHAPSLHPDLDREAHTDRVGPRRTIRGESLLHYASIGLASAPVT